MSEVSQGLEVFVGRGAMRPDRLEDVDAELGPDGRVVGELVEGPREGRGGRVAAGEQDGHDLVADDLGVARE